jgi:hypothetical protein
MSKAKFSKGQAVWVYYKDDEAPDGTITDVKEKGGKFYYDIKDEYGRQLVDIEEGRVEALK